MLEFSKRFIGLPYTWGGTSSYGYDCSGFVQMLCRRRGATPAPRRTPPGRLERRDAGRGKDVAPGDLLYFGSSEQKITHTGIYLGNGKFINATTHQTPTVLNRRPARACWAPAGRHRESEMNRRRSRPHRGCRRAAAHWEPPPPRWQRRPRPLPS